MRCTVLKKFPYAADGIKSKELPAGEPADIRDDLVAGLIEGGFVEAPETAAFAKAPETKTEPDAPVIEIPENWLQLSWPELRSLASKLSDTPITDKDTATDAIEAALAAREAPGSTAE